MASSKNNNARNWSDVEYDGAWENYVPENMMGVAKNVPNRYEERCLPVCVQLLNYNEPLKTHPRYVVHGENVYTDQYKPNKHICWVNGVSKFSLKELYEKMLAIAFYTSKTSHVQIPFVVCGSVGGVFVFSGNQFDPVWGNVLDRHLEFWEYGQTNNMTFGVSPSKGLSAASLAHTLPYTTPVFLGGPHDGLVLNTLALLPQWMEEILEQLCTVHKNVNGWCHGRIEPELMLLFNTSPDSHKAQFAINVVRQRGSLKWDDRECFTTFATQSAFLVGWETGGEEGSPNLQASRFEPPSTTLSRYICSENNMPHTQTFSHKCDLYNVINTAYFLYTNTLLGGVSVRAKIDRSYFQQQCAFFEDPNNYSWVWNKCFKDSHLSHEMFMDVIDSAKHLLEAVDLNIIR